MRFASLDNDGAVDAWALQEAERQTYRGRISCPDSLCGAPLHWRKRSRDGKAPTFYGNHVDGCDYKVEPEERIAQRELEDVEAIINTCEEMRVRLDNPSRNKPRTAETPGSFGDPGKAHVSGRNNRVSRVGSTGLRPLLRKLISTPAFQRDPMPLILSDGTRTTVAAGCQRVDDFELSSSTCIAWGQVKTANSEWINSGYRNEKLPAVRLTKEAMPHVLESAGVRETRDLTGWYFLVEGFFRRTSKNTPYVTLRDPKKITFLPPI